MDASDWIAIGASVISGGAVVVSMLSNRRAHAAERQSLADAKTQAFLAFRSRFMSIKHDLPKRWNDNTWEPVPDTDDWRRLETYWQNAFDEWFVPMRLNQEYLQEVWTLFFESAVKSALKNRPLRFVASALCESGEFGQYNSDFKGELDRLYGKPIDVDVSRSTGTEF